VERYDEQAARCSTHRAADRDALRFFHEKHPRFSTPRSVARAMDLTEADIRGASLELDDARLALALRTTSGIGRVASSGVRRDSARRSSLRIASRRDQAS